MHVQHVVYGGYLDNRKCDTFNDCEIYLPNLRHRSQPRTRSAQVVRYGPTRAGRPQRFRTQLAKASKHLKTAADRIRKNGWTLPPERNIEARTFVVERTDHSLVTAISNLSLDYLTQNSNSFSSSIHVSNVPVDYLPRNSNDFSPSIRVKFKNYQGDCCTYPALLDTGCILQLRQDGGDSAVQAVGVIKAEIADALQLDKHPCDGCKFVSFDGYEITAFEQVTITWKICYEHVDQWHTSTFFVFEDLISDVIIGAPGIKLAKVLKLDRSTVRFRSPVELGHNRLSLSRIHSGVAPLLSVEA